MIDDWIYVDFGVSTWTGDKDNEIMHLSKFVSARNTFGCLWPSPQTNLQANDLLLLAEYGIGGVFFF